MSGALPALWADFHTEYWMAHEDVLCSELAASADGVLLAALLRQLLDAPDPLRLETRLLDALERAWERLHMGPWQSVAPCWRRAYGVCAFLASQLAWLQGQWVEALRLNDLVILMGHGDLHFLAHRAAAQAWPHRAPLPVPEALNQFPPAANDDATRLPSLTDFEADFLAHGRPVVLRGLASAWPAVTRWTDAAHLNSTLGHRLVPVEVGRTYMDDGWGQRLMLFSDFYRDYVASDTRAQRPTGYLAQTRLLEQVPQLLRDVIVPDYCCMVDAGAPPPDINVWFGPEGTVSPLHTDPRHNIFVQLAGSKAVLLFGAEDTAHLYAATEGLTTNTSQVDAAAPDLERFPNYSLATTGTLTVLQAGDALFIPKGVWHYVASLQPSWSVSFWFG